jgi:hypothetical protein
MERDGFDQQSCLSWDRLCDYAFDLLGAEQRQIIDNHMSACVLCRSAAEAVRQLQQQQSLTREELEQWFEERQLPPAGLWGGGKR